MAYGTSPLARAFHELQVDGPAAQSLWLKNYNHHNHRLDVIETFQSSSRPGTPAIGRAPACAMPMEPSVGFLRVESCPACCHSLTSAVTEVSCGHAATCPTCGTEVASLASSLAARQRSECAHDLSSSTQSLPFHLPQFGCHPQPASDTHMRESGWAANTVSGRCGFLSTGSQDQAGSEEQGMENAPTESIFGWGQLQGLSQTVKGLKRKVEEEESYAGRMKLRNRVREGEADRWQTENIRVPIFLKGSCPATSHQLLHVRPHVDTVLDLHRVVEREVGLPFSAYFLVYQGKLLHPERKLAEVGIGQNSTVLVTIRGPHGVRTKRSNSCRNLDGSDLWM